MSLCDTEALVQSAITKLQGSTHLFVDLEGRDLGCIEGRLSVISVGAAESAEIFIFDVVSLDRSALVPLLAILADTTVPKFMWDGRKDSVELRRTLPGATFAGAIDLQLVDVLSRHAFGENDLARIERLQRKGHSVHALRQLPTKDVHGLVSLKNAPSEHKIRKPVLGECFVETRRQR